MKVNYKFDVHITFTDDTTVCYQQEETDSATAVSKAIDKLIEQRRKDGNNGYRIATIRVVLITHD